ncbi:hypothetical protein D3C84_1117030 [compost metagenome]
MDVGSVVVAGTQPLESGFLVAKSSQEDKREILRVKGLNGQVRDCGLNFYCVHGLPLSKSLISE